MTRATRTYVVLQVSAAAYAEIREKLEAAGYDHAFHDHDGRDVVDMHGIALCAPVIASATDNGCCGSVHVFPNTWPGAKCACGSQTVGGPMPTR